jgi:hypothetical protein
LLLKNTEHLKYFSWSFVAAIIGLAIAVGFAHFAGRPLASTLFIVVVLSILEVSISFDNAVVNATVLKKMTPIWQKRFLTWGILIAVFGMRLVFPVAIVSIAAAMTPWESLQLAFLQPAQYAERMLSVSHQVSAFGGAFLLLVALKFFFDAEKTVHWFNPLEKRLAQLGKLPSFEIGLTILALFIFSKFMPQELQAEYLIAGVIGVLTFIAVDALGAYLEFTSEQTKDIHKASVGMFIYLEVLDASFSFDGVIGAFALSQDLLVIAVGLGIGAFFVRSLTIFMVEEEVLEQFQFLEHGAFYAVASLAAVMFIHPLVHIPEVVTGLLGVGFIGWAFLSSRKA